MRCNLRQIRQNTAGFSAVTTKVPNFGVSPFQVFPCASLQPDLPSQLACPHIPTARRFKVTAEI